MKRNRIVGGALMGLWVAALGCATGGGTGAGEVQVAVTDEGFTPASVTVAHGTPTTVVMTRKTDATCATEVVFADGKTYPLPLNQPVRIEFTATPGETLHYACGMGMYHAEIVVK